MTDFILDEIDTGILNLLQVDGELTYKEISGKLKRSKSTIVERIKNLKTAGYIEKKVAIIDIQKIRNIFTAFPLVQLKNHGQDSIGIFKQEMGRHTQVMECYHVTGNFDFMLKVVTIDMTAYNDFLRENISTNPLVGKIQSFMVLSQSKRETAYMV
ncbi:Lrp/AsnC family transcriptional regulator [Pedobacter mucosus]|uniref:Lrp/AsnC family transcriptional regulator n=1 Tax=Pedobacter mucosus TaxID=2895286 RepID=UPI001EE4CDC6|nr:Lrp/AsnC family transcriptional regulator [Pedobacter mucosus]UKT65087.1 Lrp/AsnC family transcriptional regulator [Pedobacter mucosus]